MRISSLIQFSADLEVIPYIWRVADWPCEAECERKPDLEIDECWTELSDLQLQQISEEWINELLERYDSS